MAEQTPINPFAVLGLGEVWRPGPTGWQWRAINMKSSGDRTFVLVLETVGGRVGGTFDADSLRQLIVAAEQLLTDVELPAKPKLEVVKALPTLPGRSTS